MSEETDIAPVIVTFREIEKALRSDEAVGNLNEVAESDTETNPLEKTAIMAAMGNILRQLESAELDAGARVLTTAHDDRASRMQSLIASGEAANLSFDPLPAGGLEAKFDTGDWGGWASVAWQKLKQGRKHPMLRPTSATPEPLPKAARIAVIGDWGTGLYGAPRIASSIINDPDDVAMVLHLGDVYYSGTKKEMEQRLLNRWPSRPGTVNRAINSNHEMYSGGDAYFGMLLPQFGQQGSYFATQNDHWTLIGLDLAYKDHDIDDQQVAWLKQVLAQAGDRKVILFSHHQLYSHWESQGRKLWQHTEFGKILRSKRIFAWYWGHEHRCSIFDKPDREFGILARCVGHGGMPQPRAATRHLPRATNPDFANAEWRHSPASSIAGNLLSDVTVLDGPNPYITGEEDKFAPHGYAMLELDGRHLTEKVLDPEGKVIYQKTLA